jgi:hypothetical protein
MLALGSFGASAECESSSERASALMENVLGVSIFGRVWHEQSAILPPAGTIEFSDVNGRIHAEIIGSTSYGKVPVSVCPMMGVQILLQMPTHPLSLGGKRDQLLGELAKNQFGKADQWFFHLSASGSDAIHIEDSTGYIKSVFRAR